MSYMCPGCYELHGDSTCADGKLPDTAEICNNFVPPSDAVELAHAACEARPFSVCRRDDGGEYVRPQEGLVCSAGTLLTVDEFYTQGGGGEPVSSKCAEHKTELSHLIFSSLFTTGCTLPAIALLNYLFNKLRTPTERAIQGEWNHVLPAYLDRLLCRPKEFQRRTRVFASPRKLQASAPARLDRMSRCASTLPYLAALVIGIACTAMIGMVRRRPPTTHTASHRLPPKHTPSPPHAPRAGCRDVRQRDDRRVDARVFDLDLHVVVPRGAGRAPQQGPAV
jgi:hypothetical protein